MNRCPVAAVGLLWLSLTALCAAQANPSRVLILWENYRWAIIGTVLSCLIQSVLVVGLLMSRARHRRAEAEAALIAEISSKFVNLPAGEVDREIMAAERSICGFLDLDVSAIWQWSAGHPGYFSLTHYYSAQDGPQPSMRLSDTDFPWFRQLMLEGRIVPISSLDDLPAEAAIDRENARRLGIKSNLCIPLMVGGEPVGILGLNTTRAERSWPEGLVKRLQLVAQTFTNALARKHADQALRESEARMTLAAEAAEFGVWAWSISRNSVWGSERWLRLFGFAAGEDVSFEKIIQRIHPDDRETVEREVGRALVVGNDYAGEFRLVLADGTRRWIASRGRGYPDGDGTLARMLGAAIDITERKRSEDRLRTSEARLAAGTELVGLGYYEVDYGERTCFLDDRFCEICGIPQDQQLGWQSVEFWLDHVHPADRPSLSDERQKLHAGKLDMISAEYRYLHPSQGQKWLHHLARVAGPSAAAGEVRTFGALRDITPRKQAEMEGHELRGLLAHADRVTLLGQLASSLAHELSQPLGAILRNAEAAEIMLRDPSPDIPELQEIITDILHDDQRASQVIDHLRSLLKRGTIDPVPVDMHELIKSVIDIVKTDAAARLVKITTDIQAGLPMALGDGIHLQQVLLNLIVNSMDALHDCGSDDRALHVQAHTADAGMIEIHVSDNGPGIPEGNFNRLFEPFFTTKATGMGMGLPVCKTIVEAHKGKLWVAKIPDGGTRFSFTVPAAGQTNHP